MSEELLKIILRLVNEASGPAKDAAGDITQMGDAAGTASGKIEDTAGALGEVRDNAEEAVEPVQETAQATKDVGDAAEGAGKKTEGTAKALNKMVLAGLAVKLVQAVLKETGEAIDRLATKGDSMAISFNQHMDSMKSSADRLWEDFAKLVLPALDSAAYSADTLTQGTGGLGEAFQKLGITLSSFVIGVDAAREKAQELANREVEEAAAAERATEAGRNLGGAIVDSILPAMADASPAVAELTELADLQAAALGRTTLAAQQDAQAREWEANAIQAVQDKEAALIRTRADAVVGGELANEQVDEAIEKWQQEGDVSLSTINQQLGALDQAIAKYKQTGEAMPNKQAEDMRGNLDELLKVILSLKLDDATQEVLVGWLVQMKIDLDGVTESARNASAAIGGIGTSAQPVAGGGAGIAPGGNGSAPTPGGGQVIESVGGSAGSGSGRGAGGGGDGGGTVIHVHVDLDGRQIAEAVARYNRR